MGRFLALARKITIVGAPAWFLMTASVAEAGLSSIVLEVQAQNSSGTGSFVITSDQLDHDPDGNSWTWTINSPFDLIDESTSNTVATISALSLEYIADPQVSVGFSVIAGDTDTNFTVTSALLSFATLDPAVGSATGGITITDLNANGASLNGLYSGGGAYIAQYNGLAPGGTTFTELFTSPISANANGSNAVNDEFPGGGAFSSIGVPVNDISSQFSFTLSAGDQASGTSAFTVVPAPAGVALLGIGLAAGSRRRRR